MARSAKTSAQRRRLVATWRASGLSATRFAHLRAIHPRTFWGWIRERERVEAAPPAFVPVRVLEAPGRDEAVARPCVEIIVSNGTLVRVPSGTPPIWVAAIVRELRAAC